MFRKLLGLAPQETEQGAYKPSPLALKLATVSKTNYESKQYPPLPPTAFSKILILCTEEQYMTMKNGKRFDTGNHPVELFVPMLHLHQAGFAFEFVTPTGKSVKIEQWAFPDKDEAVQAIYNEYKADLEAPTSLPQVLQGLDAQSPYAAIFIPGGHGAMLGLPENKGVRQLLEWAQQYDRYVLAICHGPAALLAADANNFMYKGYKMAAFPDRTDKQTPIFGYLPGQMPWHFGERLEERGVTIVNSKPDTTCHVDRKLITAASPLAAQAFGQLAATTLNEALQGQ